jgi:dTDP-4-dehydrorhamnose reductase
MSILVLGGSGMLGHKMFQVLRESFSDVQVALREETDAPFMEIFNGSVVHRGLDASNGPAVSSMIRKIRPQFIVNCVGVIKQRDEAKESVPSILINAVLPHLLATAAMEWQGSLIHFSTDCVFKGTKGGYTEDTPTDAEDLYGRSKALGEVATSNALTLRTSIIGRELKNFRSLLEWFLGTRDTKVRGYRRALYSGVTTNYLACVVRDLISKKMPITGLYQVTGNTISKYDLLCLTKRIWGLEVDVVPDDDFFCDRSMDGTRFVKATGWHPPEWETLLRAIREDKTPYERWR